MASTLDGRIGPADVDHFVSIGSRYDLQNLIKLRDDASGVLFGASTFRAWPKVHHGTDLQRHLHHFIMSRSLDLDFQSELFQHHEIPVTVFCGAKDVAVPEDLPPHVTLVHIPEGPHQIEQLLEHVAGCGVEALIVEGGGEVLHRLIEAKALDALYLTLVPSVIGNVNAPALLGGRPLAEAPKIKVAESRLVGNENYLHLQFQYT